MAQAGIMVARFNGAECGCVKGSKGSISRKSWAGQRTKTKADVRRTIANYRRIWHGGRTNLVA